MTRVKICGITRLEDALLAQESGADALGFIFYSKSKRYIDPEKAADIISRLNPFIMKVGVFVNENVSGINNISDQCGLTHVQLHGGESPNIVSRINRSIIKAINFSQNLVSDIALWQGRDILIDSGSKEIPGGTGKTLPWEALQALKLQHPFILAGGLSPDNIEKALAMLSPAAVDISSGVESAPGIKDPELVKQFIEKVKGSKKTQ